MRKRIIFVLFIISLCLFTSNVLAVDYTEPPYNERETVVVGEPNEPVDSSEYKIDNNSSLKGGGIFKPVEIWSFRIIVILIIGGSIYFIIYKKNKNNKKSRNNFYEE